jgi:hypothetical protein
MKTAFEFLRRVWKAETFSPTALIARAVVVTVLFCVSELLGLREYTTFLSGTSANAKLGWQLASGLGLIHLLLYIAFILLVPIMLIAAGLLAVWNRLRSDFSSVLAAGSQNPVQLAAMHIQPALGPDHVIRAGDFDLGGPLRLEALFDLFGRPTPGEQTRALARRSTGDANGDIQLGLGTGLE